jgi:hypothetical protein
VWARTSVTPFSDRYSVITTGKAANEFVYHFSVFRQTAFAVDLLVPNNLDGSLIAVDDAGVPGGSPNHSGRSARSGQLRRNSSVAVGSSTINSLIKPPRNAARNPSTLPRPETTQSACLAF